MSQNVLDDHYTDYFVRTAISLALRFKRTISENARPVPVCQQFDNPNFDGLHTVSKRCSMLVLEADPLDSATIDRSMTRHWSEISGVNQPERFQ